MGNNILIELIKTSPIVSVLIVLIFILLRQQTNREDREDKRIQSFLELLRQSNYEIIEKVENHLSEAVDRLTEVCYAMRNIAEKLNDTKDLVREDYRRIENKIDKIKEIK